MAQSFAGVGLIPTAPSFLLVIDAHEQHCPDQWLSERGWLQVEVLQPG
jgi:hypothetical protein